MRPWQYTKNIFCHQNIEETQDFEDSSPSRREKLNQTPQIQRILFKRRRMRQKNNTNSWEKAIMRSMKFSIHWSIWGSQKMSLASTHVPGNRADLKSTIQGRSNGFFSFEIWIMWFLGTSWHVTVIVFEQHRMPIVCLLDQSHWKSNRSQLAVPWNE
jgi:hypothetical protein